MNERPTQKENFTGPMQQAAKMASEQQQQAKVLSKPDNQEEAISKANQAMAGSVDMDKVIEEFDSISVEDLNLAEQLIFRGYAEKEVSIDKIPKAKYTICSTDADEVAFQDEMIFDYIKLNQDKDEAMTTSSTNVGAYRNAMTIALSCRGLNQKEFCENASHHLNTIKSGIRKVRECELNGDLPESIKIKTEVKKSLKFRTIKVMQFPTPIIDFLSQRKFEFDQLMFSIMNTKNIIPKS